MIREGVTWYRHLKHHNIPYWLSSLNQSGKSIQVRDLHSRCDGEAPVLKSLIIFVISRLTKDLGPHVHCIRQS